jgi:exopolyphosphatase/guanosine-5'-triphosphate,3'-diphosphate pyrophosphatase
MRTLAAIDVGANAIRMVVATLDEAGRLSVIDRVREPVRLGTDVFASGSVSEEAIERVTDAFVRLRALVDRHGATQVRAVGTSALREAANRELVLDRVFQASGIDVEVVSADEEARLIFLGVASRVDLSDRRALLIDIGGGSVEISLATDGRLVSTSSFKLGAVRLLQVLEEKKYGERQFGRLVHGYVGAIEKLLRQELGQPVDLCVGTGGNIESLWELCRSLAGENRDGVFSQGELDTALKKLQSLTIAERIQELGLRPDRADVIVPAAIVLQHVLALAGTVDVKVPQVGLREGLLADMVSATDGKRHAPPRDQLLNWALRLGRKYAFDESHGTTVARLAAQMFDATKAVHHLDDEHRLLLELAALLHDVGHFINVSEHHKHTYYLLTANPILGLSETQTAVVANVARYHRKSPPKPHHRGYMALGPKERVATSKLAALLRVADALDTQHKGKVTDLTVDSNRRQLVIRLKGDGDLLLEKWKVMKKAGMFEEVFSLKCVVE